jgi:regulator of protease activity HflC (stomatin/prohibitin superfamily)
MMIVFLFVGALVTLGIAGFAGGGVALALFGPHLWLLLVLLAFFSWWRQSVVMVPDGCRAVVTRFGKLEEVVEPGRKLLFNPWKQVSYIVNTTREYPYNAPIREAPTASRVNASVDLFLQFRIEDPAEFIFTVGGSRGSRISWRTRSARLRGPLSTSSGPRTSTTSSGRAPRSSWTH